MNELECLDKMFGSSCLPDSSRPEILPAQLEDYSVLPSEDTHDALGSVLL